MKNPFLLAILLVALLAPGCAFPDYLKYHPLSAKSQAPADKTIVTPDMSLAARVISINDAGRFVVLTFPEDKMPKVQQTMYLYRAGMKVAEVKITGPQQEHNIVADLISGDPKVGDTVRGD